MKISLLHKMFIKLQIIAALFLSALGSGGSVVAQTTETPQNKEEQNLKDQLPDTLEKAKKPIGLIMQSEGEKTLNYKEGEKRNPPPGTVMPTPGELYKPEKRKEKQ